MRLTKASTSGLSRRRMTRPIGIARERVEEAGKLPCAEVAGEDEDALAAFARGEVMVQAFVADEAARRMLAGVVAHLAELGELPAEVAVDSRCRMSRRFASDQSG